MDNTQTSIPKKIHYCWFGYGAKDFLIQKCMKSWAEVLPDYEIVEWSEKDLDKFGEICWVKEAIRAQKWAFVSDYVRLYALYTQGGIYLDTDVEVRKKFDEFLDLDFFIGSEKCGKGNGVGTAVVGAKANNHLIQKLLEEYRKLSFVQEDGSFDMLPNPVRFNQLLAKTYNISKMYTTDIAIELENKMKIFPVNYFCLDDKKSYAVHHFMGSWLPDFRIKTKFCLPWFNGKKLKLLKFHQNKAVRDFVLPKHQKKLLKIKFRCRSFFIFILESEKK